MMYDYLQSNPGQLVGISFKLQDKSKFKDIGTIFSYNNTLASVNSPFRAKDQVFYTPLPDPQKNGTVFGILMTPHLINN